MVRLNLPFPPSVNHYWRKWRGRIVISSEGRAYSQLVAAIVARQRIAAYRGAVCVAIALYPPDRRRRDCDNSCKALLDALQKSGVFRDDSQVTWLLTLKAEVFAGGKAIVHVWPRGAGNTHQSALEDASQWICSDPINLN